MSDYRYAADPRFVFISATNAPVPDDPMDPARVAYAAWRNAGNTPDAFIPQSVTPRQARLALLAAGLLDQVEATVTSAGGAVKITWDYATEIQRNDPMIISISQALSLTSAQIDGLFRQASTL